MSLDMRANRHKMNNDFPDAFTIRKALGDRTLELENIELAAHWGYEPACRVLDWDWKDLSLEERFLGAVRNEEGSYASLVIDLTQNLMVDYVSRYPDDSRIQEALDAVEDCLNCPCEEHRAVVFSKSARPTPKTEQDMELAWLMLGPLVVGAPETLDFSREEIARSFIEINSQKGSWGDGGFKEAVGRWIKKILSPAG